MALGRCMLLVVAAVMATTTIAAKPRVAQTPDPGQEDSIVPHGASQMQLPSGECFPDLTQPQRAAAVPPHCHDFYRLYQQLVASLQIQPHQLAQAQADADAYLASLTPSCTFDNLDYDDQTLSSWWNDIAVPQALAATFVLIGPEAIPRSIYNKAIPTLNRARWSSLTGANLVWQAYVDVLRSAFEGQPSEVSRALDTVYASASMISSKHDGINHDGSFSQHRGQHLTGSYGANYTNFVLNIVHLARDTSFYISPKHLHNFARLVLDGQAWMSVGSDEVWDFAVTGRIIARPPGVHRVDFNVDHLAALNSTRRDEFLNFALRLARNDSGTTLLGHRYFFDSDYAIMRGPGYQYSIHMFSSLSTNARCINNEGKQSQLTASGTVALYYTGHEYDNIFPVWDWQQLPGALLEQLPNKPTCKSTYMRSLTSDVGGVSNGKLGATFMTQFSKPRPLKCVRSWAMFPDVLVATAQQISGPVSMPVIFTLADCRAAGSVTVALRNGKRISIMSHQLITLPAESVAWIHHDNTIFAINSSASGSLDIFRGTSSGNWISIGDSNRTQTVERFYVKWTLAQPLPNAAAYLMLPAVPLKRADDTLNTLMRELKFNLSERSAIYTRLHDNAVTSIATFADGGQIDYHSSQLGCDVSCALIIEATVGSFDFNLTVNAQAKSKLFTILLPYPTGHCDGCTLESNRTCVFHQHGFRTRSVTASCHALRPWPSRD
ncbi:uncharacterized protein MONBRDRAFT_30506 [Monosiga brevicollis MX1]|uniref:Uncharacterized protein n=1 Tax=Monosiga brevicollis TaxID=81824 RepID=A9VE58_MONBE|nr:uncharacterized protein MONBRDRAFT_30506 [Monosiga brevicollis MX1]EDQ84181.1 predicted protein [Monosiga brevicollis MX1]|eukprot:XP_001751011.1 hypothetical protein [Monosiga brevicollis MX1]